MSLVYHICICQECNGGPLASGEEKEGIQKVVFNFQDVISVFSPKSRFPWPKLILLVMQTCLRFTSVPNPCCKNRGLPRWEWEPWRLRAALESCPCCAGSWLPATSQGLMEHICGGGVGQHKGCFIPRSRCSCRGKDHLVIRAQDQESGDVGYCRVGFANRTGES